MDAQAVENYEMRDELLKCKGKMIVPSVGDLRKKILDHFYDSKGMPLRGIPNMGEDG